MLCFSGTGQDCAHTWGWQKNRELFFVEQLEMERGGENVPTRSPSNRAALAGWEAARNAGQDHCRQYWEPLCLSCWALQNRGVFPSPSPLFLPPLHHLVLPWDAWCCRGKPHTDKIIVEWHCWNSEGSRESLGAGIASLIVNTLMEKRALGIQVSWAPAKPSSSHSIAGNSHPGKSMPGVTFTGLNNLFIFLFV